MKAGSFGLDLTLAVELLAEAENIIARSGLSASSRDLHHLARNLSTLKNQLSTMLPATLPRGSNENSALRRSMEPMKIALRVLTAHANGAQPEEVDLNALERICGEKPDGVGWDEFACEAIQDVLRDRAQARKSLSSGAALLRP